MTLVDAWLFAGAGSSRRVQDNAGLLSSVVVILKKKIFAFRGRGWEGEREGEKHGCEKH